jgi:hypothetical protein
MNVNINKNKQVAVFNGLMIKVWLAFYFCSYFDFESVLALILDEIAQGAVIGPFAFRGEEAAGNLALLPVVEDAFAAIAALVAGSIGAGAMFEGAGGDAIHLQILLSIGNYFTSCYHIRV